ncbi:hypothetical protein WH52_04620 [Tenacibaculum holothuriorum]|uniref:SPOR domain-containing protein n=1 Tax=Tenacibaculum holothuriorum TaxID=1635173 RepID=A0A1Y2PEP5_9FLAO|nr:hypothetical protein [Tenacibaculum holothuriorum]OSY88952.1 hypothetical protein WH52_04620 [Tenacibaculum holothuriorum]
MKKLFFILLGILFSTSSYGQSKNGKAANNWDECVALSQTEFKNSCLGDDREKELLSPHATITNNCDQKIKVVWEYNGKVKPNGNAVTNGTVYIKPNKSKVVYVCNAIANGGTIQVTNVESADSNYTSNSNNNSSWNENTSALSDESKNYIKNSGNYNYESIYEKRRKEAEARKLKYQRESNRQQRLEEQKKLERERMKREFERQDKENVKNYKNAVNKFNNVLEGMARAKENQRKFEERELKRIAEKKRLRKLRWEEEERREKAERKRKEKIKNSKKEFMNTLSDAKIPLSYPNATAYFIIIAKTGEESIKLSKLILYKNSNNQLPYKQDVIKKFKNKYRLNNIYIQGPFTSKALQEREYQNIKGYARSSYIKVGNDINFSYGTKGKAKVNSNTDFWGKKKKTTTKKTKKKDFWN